VYVWLSAIYVHVPGGGQVGAAGDNAAMESFFALLQKDVLNRQTWAIRDELRFAIITRIERTDNRRHSALGMLTPAEFEGHNRIPAA